MAPTIPGFFSSPLLPARLDPGRRSEAADFVQLCGFRIQPLLVARPDGHASFGCIFSRVMAEVNWDEPATTFEHIQQAFHEELTRLLLTWLKQEEHGERQWQVPEETVAHIVSWAIFGAASRWCQEATTISSTQMADEVFLVIMEGVARLAPEAFPA